MERLLTVMQDETEPLVKRQQAAYLYGLLLFAEPIDDETVRITNETAQKLGTYVDMLRSKQDMEG